MLNISLSTDVFNKILKRLLSVAGGDASAIVTFYIKDKELYLYYRSKIDKSEIQGLFHEKVSTISVGGDGSFSLLIKDIGSLKIPEFVRDSKYPYCKEIKLQLEKVKLTVRYDIVWAEKVIPNTTEFNCPIVQEENFETLYEDLNKEYPAYIELDAQNLIEAINYCNFFKHDATTKSNNGCLFKTIGDTFFIIGTDSNIAARYKNAIINKVGIEQDVSTILSDSVFKLIKGFISDLQTVKLSLMRSFLFLDTGNRKMIVPIITSKYLIEDPVNFFTLKGKKISKVYLKPISSLVSLFTTTSKDYYKTVKLDFSADEFNVFAEGNSSKNMPSELFNEATVHVNGDYFNTTAQRLLNVDEHATLYYDTKSRRISLVSPEERLIFLIQGQREN